MTRSRLVIISGQEMLATTRSIRNRIELYMCSTTDQESVTKSVPTDLKVGQDGK